MLPISKRENRFGSLIMEVVGPAGAGKTTFSRALCEYGDKFVIGPDIALRKLQHIPLFVRSLTQSVPLLLRSYRQGKGVSWDELKAMAYVTEWHRLFKHQAATSGKNVLLDHGPVFRLATLAAFGPAQLDNPMAEGWWNARFDEWANTLDIVLWLDAPNTILEKRINGRDQRHVVKGKSQQEVSQFLADYRRAYEQTLTRLTQRGLVVKRFDTSKIAPEQLVHKVLSDLPARQNGAFTWGELPPLESSFEKREPNDARR